MPVMERSRTIESRFITRTVICLEKRVQSVESTGKNSARRIREYYIPISADRRKTAAVPEASGNSFAFFGILQEAQLLGSPRCCPEQ